MYSRITFLLTKNKYSLKFYSFKINSRKKKLINLINIKY